MSHKNNHKHEFLKVLQRIAGDSSILGAFLEDLLTPSEYEEIIKRWQIVKRLYDGSPQRKIANSLQVGIGTVTRGSRELLDEKGGFRRVLKMCKRKSKICKV